MLKSLEYAFVLIFSFWLFCSSKMHSLMSDKLFVINQCSFHLLVVITVDFMVYNMLYEIRCDMFGVLKLPAYHHHQPHHPGCLPCAATASADDDRCYGALALFGLTVVGNLFGFC